METILNTTMELGGSMSPLPSPQRRESWVVSPADAVAAWHVRAPSTESRQDRNNITMDSVSGVNVKSASDGFYTAEASSK